MVLEKDVAFLLKRRLDRSREHAEEARKQDLHMNLRFLDIYRRLDRISQRENLKIKLIPGPAGFDPCSAWNMFLQPVNVVGDPPPRLVLAEFVRQVDFDGL